MVIVADYNFLFFSEKLLSLRITILSRYLPLVYNYPLFYFHSFTNFPVESWKTIRKVISQICFSQGKRIHVFYRRFLSIKYNRHGFPGCLTARDDEYNLLSATFKLTLKIKGYKVKQSIFNDDTNPNLSQPTLYIRLQQFASHLCS